MSTFGKADGPAISELKWVLYIIETFKGALNGCLWANRENIPNIGRLWDSPSGLINKTKDTAGSCQRLESFIQHCISYNSHFSFKTAGLTTLEGSRKKEKRKKTPKTQVNKQKFTGASLGALLILLIQQEIIAESYWRRLKLPP